MQTRTSKARAEISTAPSPPAALNRSAAEPAAAPNPSAADASITASNAACAESCISGPKRANARDATNATYAAAAALAPAAAAAHAAAAEPPLATTTAASPDASQHGNTNISEFHHNCSCAMYSRAL